MMDEEELINLKGIDIRITRTPEGQHFAYVTTKTAPNGKRLPIARFEVDANARLVRALLIIGDTERALSRVA